MSPQPMRPKGVVKGSSEPALENVTNAPSALHLFCLKPKLIVRMPYEGVITDFRKRASVFIAFFFPHQKRAF